MSSYELVMTYRNCATILANSTIDAFIVISHDLASTLAEDRVLAFQAMMMQQERTLPGLNFISHQQSSLEDAKQIEVKKYFTSSSDAKEESVAFAVQKPSSLSNGRDPKRRDLLEDTFLGREISFPSNEAVQESDDDNSSLLDAARKTANLVESSTIFPPGMLTSHDSWYLSPLQLQQHDFSNSTLLAAAAELNLSSETPKNEAGNYIASVNAAQATSSSSPPASRTNRQEQNSPSRSQVLSQCSEKGKRHVDGRPPLASDKDDSV